MSLDFSLEIQATHNLDELLEYVISDRENNFERLTEKDGFQGDGFVCIARRIDGNSNYEKVSQEITLENFGFSPNLRFAFRPDSYDGYEIGMRNGLKAFMTILAKDKGDAVCLLNGESVKFLRKNGLLELNSESFSNDADALWRYKDVPFKYGVKKIPNIE